ncbi:MAG: VWA domain-containing protein [Gammaproteobacteria bacterium]
MTAFSWAEFHFLRPWWFLALIPLAILVWKMTTHVLNQKNWAGIIDEALLPYVLVNKDVRSKSWPKFLFGFVGLLSIIALAGPVWEQLPQPVYRNESALVIALDLSRSMDAADLKPSRLTRAKFKVADLLKQRKEGQTALLAFASEAYTVTPLTDDTDTILSQMKALSTDIMPQQGSRIDRAMLKANELLKQAGVRSGDILLITDATNSEEDMTVASYIKKSGHRVFVFGIGTKEGAPIPDQKGGYFTDASGNIVLPSLEESSLQKIAAKGDGFYQRYTENEQDVTRLTQRLEKKSPANEQAKTEAEESELKSDQWIEQGPWLLLLIIPFAALTFRKGYLLILVFCITGFSTSQEVMAEDVVEQKMVRDLWKNPNQKAEILFKAGDNKKAAELFENKKWKGSAQYKAGEYEAALESWAGFESPEDLYNKGNALAKMGQLEQALESYEKAIQEKADFEDAQYNYDQVKKALEEQQKQKDQNGDQESDQNKESKDGGGSEEEKSERSESESDRKDSSKDKKNNEESDQEKDPGEQEGEQSGQNKSGGEQQGDEQTNSDLENMQQGKEKDPMDSEEQQAAEAALRAIPDDPGGLLRRKFKYQYQQEKVQSEEAQQW